MNAGNSLNRAVQNSFLALGCVGRSNIEVQRYFLVVGVDVVIGISIGVVSDPSPIIT
jgi:hypothetical protein